MVPRTVTDEVRKHRPVVQVEEEQGLTKVHAFRFNRHSQGFGSLRPSCHMGTAQQTVPWHSSVRQDDDTYRRDNWELGMVGMRER